MKISVIGSTKPDYKASKEELEIFSGHNAGICYMAGNYDEIKNEDVNKTLRRVDRTKHSGHHSVYDHAFINFYLENIPKALAMIINNEKQYTTSEKSARYTKMELGLKEQMLYNKWVKIFSDLIKKEYDDKYPQFFTESRIEKLAQENARYLISVFTPTSMAYSTTYRQLNNLVAMFEKTINNKENETNDYIKKLKPYMQEFCDLIKTQTPYYDTEINNNAKGKELSIFNHQNINEYYGDVYATNYDASFACVAQAQRHRTLDYNINVSNNAKFYIPTILKSDEKLVKDWIKDCNSQKENYPQGMLVNVNEMGTFDNFVLKMMERKCSFAQLEINEQTNDTLHKYAAELKKSNHPRATEMESYTKGSRCTFNQFTCQAPCKFSEGITEQRKI